MFTERSFRALILSIIVALCVSVGFVATATPAQAAGGSVQVFNFGGPGNTGIGIVTNWTSPNTYQYVLGSQRWSPTMNVKGAYIGSWYCGDVYYSFDGGRTWKYQWSARGPQFISFPGWSVSWVGVYPYRC
jgi:hypothetical protein